MERGINKMDKLTREELEILIELAREKKESIHKQAIHNKELRKQEIDLDFILIKLNSQIKMLD